MQIRLCDDKKIKLDNNLNLEQRKFFIEDLIEKNQVYKEYYYEKEDGKIILDFLTTYFLNGERCTQKKIKEDRLKNKNVIKTHFKNNTLLLIPSKETKNLKKIRILDKKIKRNNRRIEELILKSINVEDVECQTYFIINIKAQNEELKKDLLYLIDDYICETELLVNYGK